MAYEKKDEIVRCRTKIKTQSGEEDTLSWLGFLLGFYNFHDPPDQKNQNGDQIDRTYLFNGTSVGSAVLEVVQSDDTASVQEGQQHMQAAKDYSDNHTEIPYFVIAGVFLLLLILLIWVLWEGIVHSGWRMRRRMK